MTTEQRSYVMSRIGSKNTKPERRIAKELRALGHEFEMHAKELPGTPDFHFRDRRVVVFYDGPFWHSRDIIKIMRMKPFWRRKLLRNWKNDVRFRTRLRRMGYRVVVIRGDDYKTTEKWLVKLDRALGSRRG